MDQCPRLRLRRRQARLSILRATAIRLARRRLGRRVSNIEGEPVGSRNEHGVFPRGPTQVVRYYYVHAAFVSFGHGEEIHVL